MARRRGATHNTRVLTYPPPIIRSIGRRFWWCTSRWRASTTAPCPTPSSASCTSAPSYSSTGDQQCSPKRPTCADRRTTHPPFPYPETAAPPSCIWRTRTAPSRSSRSSSSYSPTTDCSRSASRSSGARVRYLNTSTHTDPYTSTYQPHEHTHTQALLLLSRVLQPRARVVRLAVPRRPAGGGAALVGGRRELRARLPGLCALAAKGRGERERGGGRRGREGTEESGGEEVNGAACVVLWKAKHFVFVTFSCCVCFLGGDAMAEASK